MSRLPKPGERARILPSEVMDRIGATGRSGVVQDIPMACVPVLLDDAEGIDMQGPAAIAGMVLCTISEVELEEGSTH